MAILSGWDQRIKLTVDHTKVDANISHFPTTVVLSSTQGEEVFAELGSDANRKKIAFTKSDGTTQLYGEIEHFDYSASKAVYHVSASGWDISSSVDTDFYLYYDSTHAENTSYVGDITDTPAKSVWDSNFKAVYHMCQDPSGSGACILDSTSNINPGTPQGSMTSDDLVDGEIGKAIDFDGTDDGISIPYTGDIDPLTVEAIAKRSITTGGEGYKAVVVGKDYSGSNLPWQMRWYQDGTDSVRLTTYDSGGNPTNVEIELSEDSTDFCYLSFTKDSTNFKCFTCSNLTGTTDTLYDLNNTENIYIGLYPDAGGGFQGSISETRISSTNRSDSWIKATNHSIRDTLLSYGNEELLYIHKIISDIIGLSENSLTVFGKIYLTSSNISISETLNKIRRVLCVINNTLGISEGIVLLANMIRRINNTLGISDANVLAKRFVKIINNLIGVIEEFLVQTGNAILANDILGISESFSRLGTMIRHKNETISISEIFVPVKTMVRKINEILWIKERLYNIRIFYVLVAETLNIQENAYKTSGFIKFILDTISISGLFNRKGVSTRSISEQLDISEHSSTTGIDIPILVKISNKFIGYSTETFYHIVNCKSKFYNRISGVLKFYNKGRD